MRVLDLRDIAKEWSDEIDDGDVTRDYAALCRELGCEATPADLERWANDYEPALIALHDFTEYAQDLAEDIGAIDHNASWPMNCIDWEHAAQELQYDYSLISFDGDDYWIRST